MTEPSRCANASANPDFPVAVAPQIAINPGCHLNCVSLINPKSKI
jgi:hypothetical protein